MSRLGINRWRGGLYRSRFRSKSIALVIHPRDRLFFSNRNFFFYYYLFTQISHLPFRGIFLAESSSSPSFISCRPNEASRRSDNPYTARCSSQLNITADTLSLLIVNYVGGVFSEPRGAARLRDSSSSLAIRYSARDGF